MKSTLVFCSYLVLLLGCSATKKIIDLGSLRVEYNERGHLNLYSSKLLRYCSYLIRMNSRAFRHADIFFADHKVEANLFSYSLPAGNIHVSIQEIACSRDPVLQHATYFPFVNSSLSSIEKEFPCSLKLVFNHYIHVHKVSTREKLQYAQVLCNLRNDKKLKVLILGDSVTQEILPFLKFKCKEKSYMTFSSYFPEESDCVFFGQKPVIRVGLKVWLHYGDFSVTLARYDVIIISAGIHDLAPLHDRRMELWVKKKFKFSGSPSDPYFQLGFGTLPFREKPQPIQDFDENLNSLLRILSTLQPSVKYLFISIPFSRWHEPSKRNKYRCTANPQRFDIIEVMNQNMNEVVGSQHFLDIKQLSLCASSKEEDIYYKDSLHAKMGEGSMTRIKAKARKIERKICEMSQGS